MNGFAYVHPDELEYTRQRLNDLLGHPGEVITVEYRLRHKDGSWRWMEGTATNLLHDLVIGAIVVNFRDITERKQIEEERAQLLAREQDFLSMVSHELRTPLQSIMGFVELALLYSGLLPRPLSLEAEELTGKIETVLKQALRQVNIEARLVEELLDVSRLETQPLDLAVQRCNLAAIVQEAVASQQQAAAGAGVGGGPGARIDARAAGRDLGAVLSSKTARVPGSRGWTGPGVTHRAQHRRAARGPGGSRESPGTWFDLLVYAAAGGGSDMRALLQRVSRASVTVDGRVTGAIGPGLLVLLGIGRSANGDSETQIKAMAEKIVHLRVFEDDEGKMNRSLLDTGGQMLVVSQFTLYADTRKGRRPSFTDAAPPAIAEPLVERFKDTVAAYGLEVAGGVFGAHMDVELLNSGPVTIWLDSEEWQR